MLDVATAFDGSETIGTSTSGSAPSTALDTSTSTADGPLYHHDHAPYVGCTPDSAPPVECTSPFRIEVTDASGSGDATCTDPTSANERSAAAEALLNEPASAPSTRSRSDILSGARARRVSPERLSSLQPPSETPKVLNHYVRRRASREAPVETEIIAPNEEETETRAPAHLSIATDDLQHSKRTSPPNSHLAKRHTSFLDAGSTRKINFLAVPNISTGRTARKSLTNALWLRREVQPEDAVGAQDGKPRIRRRSLSHSNLAEVLEQRQQEWKSRHSQMLASALTALRKQFDQLQEYKSSAAGSEASSPGGSSRESNDSLEGVPLQDVRAHLFSGLESECICTMQCSQMFGVVGVVDVPISGLDAMFSNDRCGWCGLFSAPFHSS